MRNPEAIRKRRRKNILRQYEEEKSMLVCVTVDSAIINHFLSIYSQVQFSNQELKVYIFYSFSMNLFLKIHQTFNN